MQLLQRLFNFLHLRRLHKSRHAHVRTCKMYRTCLTCSTVSIETYPTVVGRLSDEEAQNFSRPFRHQWATLRAADMLEGAEKIVLSRTLEDEQFGLPETYAQFVPAIGIAVAHERAVRHDLSLRHAHLTIRRWQVDAGNSQQMHTATGFAHQDSRGERPERFYTVSDKQTTQFFPDIPPLPALIGRGPEVQIAADQPYVDFKPYDVVHASALTYHRSPPMLRSGVRTFLRLTFQYEA